MTTMATNWVRFLGLLVKMIKIGGKSPSLDKQELGQTNNEEKEKKEEEEEKGAGGGRGKTRGSEAEPSHPLQTH